MSRVGRPSAGRARLKTVAARAQRPEVPDAWIGGEDQLFRITFRAEAGEAPAFEHFGPGHFRAGWGNNVVGLLLDRSTDWDELAELLTDSYCL